MDRNTIYQLRHEVYAAELMQHSLNEAMREEFSKELLKFTPLEVLQSKANFILCYLPENGPDAASIVSKCKEMNLYLRDVSNMGNNFNKHTIRIAIKDKETNQKMLEIIKQVLDH